MAIDKTTHKKFNLNDTIQVKLNEKGIKIWSDHFNRYPTGSDYKFMDHYRSYTDVNGFSSFQLHVFLEIFGGNFSTSAFDHPFDGTWVYVKNEDIKEI